MADPRALTELGALLAAAGGSPAVVTIGTFDGVHAGHRVLLSRAHALARARGQRLVAVTFSPRPEHVVRGRALPDICSLEERVRRLRAAGADEVVVVPFTRELMALDAEAFVGALRTRLPMTALCVGEEFRLGRGRGADVAALRALGLEVHAVAVAVRPGRRRKVSSSTIRRAIAAGVPAALALDGLAPVLGDDLVLG